MPGPHDFPGKAMAQVQGVEQDLSRERGAAHLLLRGGKEQAQFLFGMGAFGFRNRGKANLMQKPLRGRVQDHDEWIREPVEPEQRVGNRERRGQGPLNGQPFGGLFARADVEESDHGKADGKRQDAAEFIGFNSQPAKDGVEEGCEHWFANPAQAQAGQRDSKLRGTEERIQPPQYQLRYARPAVSPFDEGTQLSVADLDEREFCCDEKCVKKDEHQHRQKPENDRDGGALLHATDLPPRI